MTKIIGAATLDDALDALAACVAACEARGEHNLIFCEDRLTLLAERAVLSRSGGTFSTEVTTFARFLSGNARVLSKQGSVLAVASLIAAHEGELRCFGKGSAEAVYETIAQLSASRVDAELLRRGAEETEGILRAKLEDLALLLGLYTDFLREKGMTDENGFLALLPERVEREARDTNLFFFAFPSFTRQAQEGVRAAILHAENVTGVFLAGRADFYTNEGARTFRRIAEECGETKVSMAPCTLAGEALALRDGMFSPDAFVRPAVPAKNVFLFRAADESEEMERACAIVKKCVAEGQRYRDIVVLVPDPSSFLAAEKAFSAYKIPFYADKKRRFSEHPFCAFVRNVLTAVSDGALPQTADAIAASPYFGDGDLYRNYLLRFGNYRGAVRREIRKGEEAKGYDPAPLSVCRERMLAALAVFPKKGKGRTFCEGVRKLYELFGGESVTQTLVTYAEGEEKAFLDIAPLEKTLAETETVAGGEDFTARDFAALLWSGLSATEISMIPQSADAVFVGDATESRFRRARTLICAGLTDALPRASEDTAVITDGEIGKLSELRVEIEPAIAVVNARARESLALNLCSFGGALYLGCPLRKGGEEAQKSEALSYAERVFTLPPMPELFPYDCCEPAPAALALLRAASRVESGRERDGVLFSSLYAALCEAGEKARADALLSGGKKEAVADAAKLWFTGDVSPTLLEKYFECPYAGFASRALRVREREERTLLDKDTGNFVHTVLELVAPALNGAAGEDAFRALAEETAKDLLASPRYSALSETEEGRYAGERLVKESAEIAGAAYRQLALSAFRVRDTEETLALPDLSVSGRADRVDAAGDYVRVIDYKTGSIDDKPVSYYTGRKLQLQLYLLAALRGGKAAGAFYFPASENFSEEGEEKYRMKGFFSKEDEVSALMDPARAEGEKSAFYEGGGKTEKGMTQADFEDFLDYSRFVSAGAEREMREGNVAPSPYEGACEFCKFKGMCGFVGEPRREGTVGCADIVRLVKEAKEERTL